MATPWARRFAGATRTRCFRRWHRIPLIVRVPDRFRQTLTADADAVALSTDLTPTFHLLAGHASQGSRSLVRAAFVRPARTAIRSPRRREASVVASSYGGVYGVLRENGIATVHCRRREQSRLRVRASTICRPRASASLPAERALDRQLIRRQIDEIASLYHFVSEVLSPAMPLTPDAYALLGLTAIIGALVAALTFALFRFLAAARDARRSIKGRRVQRGRDPVGRASGSGRKVEGAGARDGGARRGVRAVGRRDHRQPVLGPAGGGPERGSPHHQPRRPPHAQGGRRGAAPGLPAAAARAVVAGDRRMPGDEGGDCEANGSIA